jgi:hypothetical protein
MTGLRSISNPAASQVLRPKFRVRVTILLAMSCIFLLTLGVLWHGYERGYAGFGVVGTIVFIWEYCKERSLIRDSQVASAVITESRIRWRGAPHLCEGAPRIKYFFSASDYKIYTGEAGSNIRDIQEGMQIPVLYRKADPRTNLPLRSFLFYSVNRSASQKDRF